MRESNAIFPEIKYDLRKCLECDDIFTPAYRHPHQKFCKNPICCRHRDARRKSLSHQRLMRNPAYRQALSQRKSREYYHRKNLRTLRQAPEQAPEIRPSNSGERAVVISSFFKSNTLQAPEQAPENSYTHSCFSVNVQCLAFSSLNLRYRECFQVQHGQKQRQTLCFPPQNHRRRRNRRRKFPPPAKSLLKD